MLNPAFCHPYTFWVLSRMALIESRKKESGIAKTEDDDCHGHGCYKADCCQGYGRHFQGGYNRDNQRQVPLENHAEL